MTGEPNFQHVSEEMNQKLWANNEDAKRRNKLPGGSTSTVGQRKQPSTERSRRYGTSTSCAAWK